MAKRKQLIFEDIEAIDKVTSVPNEDGSVSLSIEDATVDDIEVTKSAPRPGSVFLGKDGFHYRADHAGGAVRVGAQTMKGVRRGN